MQISIQNFRSWKKKSDLTIPNQPGLYLVSGENLDDPSRLGGNGTGKSSMFDSIAWVLFGSTLGGEKGGQVATKGKISVTIDYCGHKITRNASPGSITVDEKEVTAKELSDLVGMTIDEYANICHFGQKYKVFIEWSHKEQMILLSELLGLDRWSNYSERASQKVINVKKIIEQKKANLSYQKSSIDTAEESIGHYRAESVELYNKLISLELEVKEFHEKSIQDVHVYDQNILEFQKYIDTANTKISEIDRDLASFTILERESFEKIAKEEAVLNSLLGERVRLDDLSGKVCPECLQEVSGGHVSEKMSLIDKEIEKQKEIHSNLIAFSDNQKSMIERLKTERKSWEETLRSVMQDFNELKDHIQSIESENALNSKLKLMTQNTLIEYQNNYQQKMDFISKKVQEVETISSDVHKVEKEIFDLEYESSILSDLVKEFQAIGIKLMDDALYTISNYANRYLSELMSGWYVKFSTDKEMSSGETKTRLNITVVSSDGLESSINKLSGGEEQRIRVATTLAIADYLSEQKGISVPFQVFDESMIFLSPEGSDNILQMLRNRAIEKAIPIFFIDHKSDDSQYFDGKILIRKENGESRLEANILA